MVNISEGPMRSGGENSMSTDAPEEYRARRNSSLIDSTYTENYIYIKTHTNTGLWKHKNKCKPLLLHYILCLVKHLKVKQIKIGCSYKYVASQPTSSRHCQSGAQNEPVSKYY